MAQRTIARLYDSYDNARTVVSELEASGIPHSEISLVANAAARGASPTASATSAAPATGASSAYPAEPGQTHTGTGGGTGAVLGTAVGGGLGLLAGIGALAIPGVGPVVAAGWLVATLAGAGVGAAAGGLVGSLTGAGISRDEAHVYAEGVRGGGSLVTVRTDEANVARIEEVMGRHAPVDWQQRRAAYGPDWKGFDETSSGRVHNDTLTGRPNTDVAPDVPVPGADGSFAPGTDPGRRL